MDSSFESWATCPRLWLAIYKPNEFLASVTTTTRWKGRRRRRMTCQERHLFMPCRLLLLHQQTASMPRCDFPHSLQWYSSDEPSYYEDETVTAQREMAVQSSIGVILALLTLDLTDVSRKSAMHQLAVFASHLRLPDSEDEVLKEDHLECGQMHNLIDEILASRVHHHPCAPHIHTDSCYTHIWVFRVRVRAV